MGNHYLVRLRDGIAAAMNDATKELKTVEGTLIEAPISGGAASDSGCRWADVVVLALGEPKNYLAKQNHGLISSSHSHSNPWLRQLAVGKPTVVLLKTVVPWR